MGQTILFDIEGTLITGNTWRNVIAQPQIARDRVRLAYAEVLPIWFMKRIGLLDDSVFRHRWMVAMARLFKGWKRSDVAALFERVAGLSQYHADVVARLKQHKHDGDHVVLVSGLFEDGAREIAKHVGADGGTGTKLAYENEVCTGRLDGASCVGERKLEFVQAYMKAKNLPPDLSVCYAYADSYSDVPMLSAVGNPVATYPEEKLRVLALERHWAVFPT